MEIQGHCKLRHFVFSILIVASGWMRILFAEFSKALEDRRGVWISLPFTGAIPAS
jgi:hypothetical protein